MLDNVVVINLPDRTDRRQNITERLGKTGLSFHVVDAISASGVHEMLDYFDLDVNSNLSDAELACYLSHQLALGFGVNTHGVFVLEDDAELVDGFIPLAEAAIRLAASKSNAFMINFGVNTGGKGDFIASSNSPDGRYVTLSANFEEWLGHCYYISAAAIALHLQKTEITHSIDHQLYLNKSLYNVFATTPCLAHQDNTPSSIR